MALINLCKMKTHALERVTGGVKNLYGCISGLHKAKGHTKYTNADIFARQLIDLNADQTAVLRDGRDRGDGWKRTDFRRSGEDESAASGQ